MKTVLIIALIVALVVAVLLIVTPSRPRITVIKHEETDEDRDA